MRATELPLPAHWPKLVCRAVTVVADMAHKSMIKSRSWAANSPIERVRLKAKLERAEAALANQREVNRILTARLSRVSPHKRPQYRPHERLAILEYRGVNALSLCETAKLFLVMPETISTWQMEIDSDTDSSLFRFHEPVNRYPEFLTQVVQRLKALCPHLGTKKIAAFLTRAALQVPGSAIRSIITPVRCRSNRVPAT